MLLYVYLIAITAEAMSGALAAGKRNMDLFGVALIAFICVLPAVIKTLTGVSRKPVHDLAGRAPPLQRGQRHGSVWEFGHGINTVILNSI